MKALKLSVLSALLLSSAAALAQAKDVDVREVTAEEAIVNGNKDKAREVAVKKALREAVEQVAGVLVSSDTLTANSTLVSDRIYSRSEGYVKSWKVLSEKDEGGVLTVTVRAEVGTKDLDKDLQAVKALVARLGNRKLVILIQEQTLQTNGNVSTSGVLATVLTDGLKADGWTIIDPSFANGEVTIASAVGTGQITEAAIKRIRDISKADYILYGKAGFHNQEGSGLFGGTKDTFFLVTGEYELSVFATDSGTQITTVAGKLNFDPVKGDYKKVSPVISYERSAMDLTKLRGPEILGQVRKSIVDHLSSAEQNGDRYVMTVLGLSTYSAVQGFKKLLAGETGVREVRPGKFGNGKAEFDVVFVGTSDELAEKIGSARYAGKTVNVTGVSGNTIEITLAK